MEFDLDFVGHGTDIRPRAFADGKVEPFDGQCAVKNTRSDTRGALLFESEWRARVGGLAFDSQLAKDFKAFRPEDFDRRGDKFCRWKELAVEPLLAGDFIITFAGAGVDTGQIDVDLGSGDRGLGRIKIQLRSKFAKLSVHRHTHLFVAKTHATFVGLNLGKFGRLTDIDHTQQGKRKQL